MISHPCILALRVPLNPALGLPFVFICLVLLVLAGCSQPQDGPTFVPSDSYETAAGSRPWTDLDFVNDPKNFQFVVVTDRTGGHRPGVFPAILEKVNLMQPELILSVGDYIEGYTLNEQRIDDEWAEIAPWLDGLDAPFFFVAGNHDYSNAMMAQKWDERFGRSYYAFKYHDALFMILNTEDPPHEYSEEQLSALEKAMALNDTNPEQAREFASNSKPLQEIMALVDEVRLSEDQKDWALRTLETHKDARWTFVFMHQPLWKHELQNFADIEKALAGRGYTMFAGHNHTYDYQKRNGNDYMQLGTTGGIMSKPLKPKDMDHITWVTMRDVEDGGPLFAHLVATGILEKGGVPNFVPGAEFCGEHYNIECINTER